VLFVLVGGCTSSGTPDNPTPTANIYTPTTGPTATPAGTQVNYHLTGHGNQATEKFHLNAGAANFVFTLTIKDTQVQVFQAYLYDGNGARLNIIANGGSETVIKDTEQIRSSGDYYIMTNTLYDWDITISQ
jgi:hypothetical protein